MPVYNGDKYLRQAIKSILHQTFTDFEFLIINDGSTDKSADIIKSFTDPRIRLLENSRNLGLIRSLNMGIDAAHGEYVARMDCDDISTTDRLTKQVAFMDAHHDVGVCGSWYKSIGERRSITMKPPLDDHEIRFFLAINTPFAHPSVILRKSLLQRYDLRYNSEFTHAEDFELWVRLSAHTKLANIPDVLLLYRNHKKQISRQYSSGQLASANRVRALQLSNLGMASSIDEFNTHNAVFVAVRPDSTSVYPISSFDFLHSAEDWLRHLLDMSNGSVHATSPFLKQFFGKRWFTICMNSTGLGWDAWKFFWNSPLSKLSDGNVVLIILFWMRCAFRRKTTLILNADPYRS